MTGAVIRWAAQVYRLLLQLTPTSFRCEYGNEMVTLFRERCARAAETGGWLAVLVCAVRGWTDVVWCAFAGRFHIGERRADPSPIASDTRLRVLATDARIAARTFLRQPLFTGTVLLTLAIGIGAPTAIFGIVHKAVLRPLPYPRAAELVSVVQNDVRFGPVPFSVPYLDDFRDRLGQFESLAGFTSSWNLTLTGSGEPRVVTASYVSDGLLELLGSEIAQGRNISAAEHASGTARVVVVSPAFWRQQFGEGAPFDEPIVRLNDVPHVIVGVLRDDLVMPITGSIVNDSRTSAEIWLPLSTNEMASLRMIPIMNLIGRLRAGATLAAAQAELVATASVLGNEHPEVAVDEVLVMPLQTLVSRDIRAPMLLLLAATAGLLLIACANVGHLMLARAAGRSGELAVRASLGATRARLVTQMLIESLILAASSAVFGIGVAWLSLRVFPALGLERLPPSATPVVDVRVTLFAVCCALATAMLVGIVPALAASRLSPHNVLKETGRTTAGRGRKARQMLVFAEVSVALVLLISAGLLARSFWTLTSVDSGIRADRVLAGEVALPASRYSDGSVRSAFVEAALARLAATRDVVDAALVNRLPFSGSNVLVGVEVEGLATGADAPTMDRRVVSPDYFDAMGIPLLTGRPFGSEDRPGTDDYVAIVNATAARRYWPDREPIGRRVRLLLRSGPGPWLRIVGIAGDVRHHGLDQAPQPEIYVPYSQAPVESFTLLVRTNADPLALSPVLRQTIQQLDSELPLNHLAVASDGIAQSIAEPRMRTLIFNLFASVSLLLATIGIYGVISYSVATRTRDIGLRLAFGAQRADIFRLVLREGMVIVFAAVIVGIGGSLVFTRFLEAQLFGVSATDPITFTTVTAVLLVAAFLAHVIPATRAMRLDPAQALRAE